MGGGAALSGVQKKNCADIVVLWFGLVWFVLVCLVRFGFALVLLWFCFGLVWLGWFGLIWAGLVWVGLVWVGGLVGLVGLGWFGVGLVWLGWFGLGWFVLLRFGFALLFCLTLGHLYLTGLRAKS